MKIVNLVNISDRKTLEMRERKYTETKTNLQNERMLKKDAYYNCNSGNFFTNLLLEIE